jgi:dihydroxyacetone kinase-like protein
MKKFINDPEHLVSELLEGLALAFPDQIRLASNNIITRAVPKSPEKVRLITLGAVDTSPD